MTKGSEAPMGVNHNIILRWTPFRTIHDAFVQAAKAVHNYQTALAEVKSRNVCNGWGDVSVVLPANTVIKGITLSKSKHKSRKDNRIYGNKDILWFYRKSSFYVPFYNPVLNTTSISYRYVVRPIRPKLNRNIRPKGTHSHFKFYR